MVWQIENYIYGLKCQNNTCFVENIDQFQQQKANDEDNKYGENLTLTTNSTFQPNSHDDKLGINKQLLLFHKMLHCWVRFFLHCMKIFSLLI